MSRVDSGAPYHYWNESQHVWWPGCAWIECHVALVRDVCADDINEGADDDRWAWWAGQAVDPMADGGGDPTWETASRRGIAPTRRAAETMAGRAMAELEAQRLARRGE